jgi:hypothetical protein
MSDPNDPFQYERWPAGTFNDGFTPWGNRHEQRGPSTPVVADPAKGQTTVHWGRPPLHMGRDR